MDVIMKVTEEEAEDKWCPKSTTNCIGSRCMWWITIKSIGTDKDKRFGYCGAVK